MLFSCKQGGNGVNLNLRMEMIPGLCVLIAGALITYFAKWLCRKPQNLPQVKLLGVGMAVIVAKEDADKAIAALDCGAYVIGEIVSGEERVTLC